MRGSFIILFSSLLVACGAAAQAGSTLDVQITSSLKNYSVVLHKDQIATKRVRFWFVSNGNSSEVLDMYLEAPPKTSATLKAGSKGSLDNAAFLASADRWYTTPFITANGRERKTLLFEPKNILLAARAPVAAAALMNCTGFSRTDVESFIAFQSAVLNRRVTQAELCGPDFVPIDEDQEPEDDPPAEDDGTFPYSPFDQNNIAKTVSTILSKDACARKDKSSYIVAVELDLTNIDLSLYDTGVTVAANFNRRVYKGDMSASIKPVSDGKYAPHPIVLMAALESSYWGGGKERIRLVRWNRGKVRKTTSIRVVKYAPHFDSIYAVGLVSKVLTGGKGSFEITNGQNAYSACFNLVRRRQRVNGYK